MGSSEIGHVFNVPWDEFQASIRFGAHEVTLRKLYDSHALDYSSKELSVRRTAPPMVASSAGADSSGSGAGGKKSLSKLKEQLAQTQAAIEAMEKVMWRARGR